MKFKCIADVFTLEDCDHNELVAAILATDVDASEEDKVADNYAKGRVLVHGLKIAIETPKGTARSGVDEDGVKWSTIAAAHYGYIRNTLGADGDEIDVFIGDALDSQRVFVIDQVDEKGEFDEHKVMLCFDNMTDAKQAYLNSYTIGWTGMGAVSSTDIDGLVAWLAMPESKVGRFSDHIIHCNGKQLTESISNAIVNDMYAKPASAFRLESVDNRVYIPIPVSSIPGWYISMDHPPFAAREDGYVINLNTGNITKGSADDRGYLRTAVYDKLTRTKKDVKVHGIVCSAFHGPRPEGAFDVDHINDVRGDNRPVNLRWLSRAANMKKANDRRAAKNRSSFTSDMYDNW